MYDCIVIGSGQAGLAAAYYLKNAKQNFLLLDKGKEIGESWKERYDSLVLFTPRLYSSLPGLSLEGEEQGFPSKDEIVDYLNKYVETFQFPIQWNEEVIKVLKEDHYFLIHTKQHVYKAKNVIIATGPFQTPIIPKFSKNLSPTIKQLHSSEYKNPDQLNIGNVIVVGGGNSGAQIAVELSKVKETYLAVSKKLNYLPLVIRDKSIFWWFDRLGILQVTNQSFLGKMIQKKGDPIFGFELKEAIQNKEVKVKNRVVHAQNNELAFDDRTSLVVNNVIWATGYKTEFNWLQINGVFNSDGKVIHNRGVPHIEGIYFIGLPWQFRRGSALLQGVGQDAQFIVNKIMNQD